VKEDALAGFASGTRLTLPPFSMLALQWHVK